MEPGNVRSERFIEHEEPLSAQHVKASRNPIWARDELILALNLYMRNRPALLGPENDEVLELSVLLGTMGRLLGRSEGNTFRNGNGVSMKMGNFRRFDPEYRQAGKKGLSRGNKDEEIVWSLFAHDLAALENVANAIRSAVELGRLGSSSSEAASIEEAREGQVLTKLHQVRERDRRLVKAKKAHSLRTLGRLACEACDMDFSSRYGCQELFEVHHLQPLGSLPGSQITRLEDLAVLCPNCHRVMHASSDWGSIDSLRQSVRQEERGLKDDHS